MKATFLGTGTSVGIPVIGCDCPVCVSDDPRNRRARTSLYVEAGGQYLLVDTAPDFREQALRFKLPRVDAVLFTHAHADHIFGFDDIRRFNTLQNAVIPAYGSPDTIANLNRVFHYIRQEHVAGVFRPQIEAVRVTPLPVEHGPDPTFGYRFDCAGRSLAYVPDCKRMPAETLRLVRGVDVMILDALRHREHVTHLTVAESVELLQRIGARRSFIDHLCHDLDHEATQRQLPSGIEVPYDGLSVAC
jgi:phosphoribosyl 1,2-cyclic phosphate phosphodiesterase